MLSRCDDPLLGAALLNQALGDFDHAAVPIDANIWIAGCGTVQAVDTALRYPHARVLGSDISTTSLATTERIAKQVGVETIELREQSILDVDYREAFDYVISTGVIHHAFDPKHALARLATAVKPDGVIEIMVYHEQHRAVINALQQGVRLLSGTPTIDFELELDLVERLVAATPDTPRNQLDALLLAYRDAPRATIGDDLLQPIEHTFTVSSLRELATSCGLELVAPRLHEERAHQPGQLFFVEFDEPKLGAHLEALPDATRWEVSSLLQYDEAPWIWFYMQRADGGRRRRSEAEVAADFLARRFTRISTTQHCHALHDDGVYRPLDGPLPFPLRPPPEAVGELLERLGPERTPAEVLRELGVEPTPRAVLQARCWLTTPAFPFITATQSPRPRPRPR